MMTDTLMFGFLVAMVAVQAWVWCLRGAFLVTVTEKKKHSVTQARNHFLQIKFTVVYAMSKNGWLAFNTCREKKSRNYL